MASISQTHNLDRRKHLLDFYHGSLCPVFFSSFLLWRFFEGKLPTLRPPLKKIMIRPLSPTFYPESNTCWIFVWYFFFAETFGCGWQWLAAGDAGSHSKQWRDRVKGLWQGKIFILFPHNLLLFFFCARSDVLFLLCRFCPFTRRIFSHQSRFPSCLMWQVHSVWF